jgi:hypothetical protein
MLYRHTHSLTPTPIHAHTHALTPTHTYTHTPTRPHTHTQHRKSAAGRWQKADKTDAKSRGHSTACGEWQGAAPPSRPQTAPPTIAPAPRAEQGPCVRRSCSHISHITNCSTNHRSRSRSSLGRSKDLACSLLACSPFLTPCTHALAPCRSRAIPGGGGGGGGGGGEPRGVGTDTPKECLLCHSYTPPLGALPSCSPVCTATGEPMPKTAHGFAGEPVPKLRTDLCTATGPVLRRHTRAWILGTGFGTLGPGFGLGPRTAPVPVLRRRTRVQNPHRPVTHVHQYLCCRQPAPPTRPVSPYTSSAG